MKKFTFAAVALLASAFSMSAYDASALYVVGSGCEAGWSPEKALEMTEVSNNVFTWTGELKSDGEFKFIIARDWHPSITCDFNTENQQNQTVESDNTYKLFVRQNDTEGKDNKFQVSVTGVYTLNVDLNEMEMYAALDEVIEEPLTLYMVGNATAGGWDLDNAMKQPFTLLEDGTFSWSGELTVNPEDASSGCFRIISEHDWWNNSYSTTLTEGNQEIEVGEYDIKFYETRPEVEVGFRIKESGLYTINVDVNTLKMIVSEKSEELYIIGNALNGGSDLWDLSWAQACTPTGNEHEFEWNGQLFQNSEAGNPNAQFRFICQGNDWQPGFVATTENQKIEIGKDFEIAPSKDAPDWKFTVPADGWYKLRINTATLKMTVQEGAGVESVAADGAALIINGLTLTVNGGTADVYDTMGHTVALNAAEVNLPAAGIYVAVVNGNAYKIAAK